MHPAFSVIFLTTLIGVGQGLFLALYTGQLYALANLLPAQSSNFYAVGSMVSLVLLFAGLIASFFHLGHPERAWRAATQWRTSWLSREVLALPAAMGLIFLYGTVHFFGLTKPLFVISGTLPVDFSLIIGGLGTLAVFGLFLCTAMIYASLRFIKAWYSPLTVANFLFLGIASGFMLASAFSAYQGNSLVGFYGTWAVIATLFGLLTRVATLYRNSHFRCKVDLKSAVGVHHSQLEQKAQGFMGGSFNTREFFHGKSQGLLNLIRYAFLLMVFAVPVILILLAYALESETLPLLAFGIQYLGLILERYHFFTEAQHPQNLYYQSMA
ncbi:dimethyl sulfoxide reductase anchor subunit family protein [endosymbiont of Lamellibrachia barhami]|uniref:dimethyl sulfoxide reductase anchor subunit family protein n=1 Tax=endosymbiont of Lamellibrachia barhami TaxID=205975 RepID=UPI0015A80523|nr:DmsC/YnfH family molybdoenzyme membrane anchor subunit [endosymbiont of Lamellibrachia barhami]